MGERINHIDQGTSLSPERNYSHIDMVRKRELLMERCSPEEVKETEAAAATTAATATATATAAATALGPFFFLRDGAAVEIDLPLKTAALGEEFSWCPLT